MLSDDPPNPLHVKIGALGQIVRPTLGSGAMKRKIKKDSLTVAMTMSESLSGGGMSVASGEEVVVKKKKGRPPGVGKKKKGEVPPAIVASA